ncbi:MAG: polysaccharide biosynthesis protein [Acidimicrobiales bacterium]
MAPEGGQSLAAITQGPEYGGKRVLITGGTGSFGQTMVRYLLEHDVAEVRILSRDEAKQHYMRIDFDDPRLQFHVGDVRDERSVQRSVEAIDLVFHAAALKQVPSCEFFPMQAVMTNIIGSANVIDSAQSAGVSSVVCLSTDKAVMPVNAMGMTKALMEKVAEAAARASSAKTIVSTVRYGNVLYSRGSVVPLFIDQIKSGEVITVTDPEMTRFLMPLSQCVDLVEFAFFNAEPGDTFIRKAYGATIGDLADGVNGLFGDPSALKVIGSRHGEKLFETLATADELRRAEDMGNYFRLPMDSRDLNYAEYFEIGDPEKSLAEDYNSHNTERLDVEGVRELLLTLPQVRAELDGWAQ